MAFRSEGNEASGLSIDRSGLFQMGHHSHKVAPSKESETSLVKHLKALIQVLHHAQTQTAVVRLFLKEHNCTVTSLCWTDTVLDITEVLLMRSSGAALSLWQSTCR